MNLNILSYLIYTIITIYVTVFVGYKFHKNGLVFIQKLCENKATANAINNVLLILYYCFNIGYSILLIPSWETVNSWVEVVNSVANKAGSIILLLAIMHYINMGWIYLLFKRKNNQLIIHKNQ